MLYKLGHANIKIEVVKTYDEVEMSDVWICTAEVGGEVIAKLSTPYSVLDVESSVEYDFCRMVAWELSKSTALLLVGKYTNNE